MKMIQTEKLVKLTMATTEDEYNELEAKLKKMSESKEKTRLRTQLRQLKEQISEEKSTLENEYKYFEETLKYLNEILPTNSFIRMQHILAPLKNNFLREKSNELMFKYWNNDQIQATLIGKVTSRINNLEQPDFKLVNEVLFELPKILLIILNPLGVMNLGDFIVSPVAIYFE